RAVTTHLEADRPRTSAGTTGRNRGRRSHRPGRSAGAVPRRAAYVPRLMMRTVAAVIGCGMFVVGLLHYRDTEPSGEIHWIVLGLGILLGSGVVHLWVVRTHPRTL